MSNLPIAADVSATAMSDGLSFLNTVYSTESYNSAGRCLGLRELRQSAIHPLTGDGMEGMTTAAIFALQHSLGKQAAWDSFAEGYGQWLVSNQNSDGSFYRAYYSNGQVWQPTASCVYSDSGGVIDVQGTSKANTTFPIRFLVELWFATNNPVYRTAAINDFAYAKSNMYTSINFTGGITDRNALDRESGVQALHAALALYDLYYAAGDSTNAQLWLANAEVAAGYVQSWQFIWNYALTDASMTTVNNGFPQWVYAGSRATSLPPREPPPATSIWRSRRSTSTACTCSSANRPAAARMQTWPL